tara:strand:+ start:324 stop:671 length:348 start_codon:yes stop_codon:yes gene_type:complete
MHIKDFTKNPLHGNDKGLPYDVVEDTLCYMRNDPMFYRKHYYPAIAKLADHHRAGKKFDPASLLSPMIEKGCDAYCRKYNIARSPEEIFSNDDRNNILEKIQTEETEQINKGEYK